MELWVRSQDKEQLRKIVDIKYQKGTFENENIEVIIGTTQYDEWEVLGQYKTKERALEVLDDISSKIKNRYIVKPSAPIISTKDISNEETRLNYLYSGEFIMEEPPFEIKPINNNIIYYEMPEE